MHDFFYIVQLWRTRNFAQLQMLIWKCFKSWTSSTRLKWFSTSSITSCSKTYHSNFTLLINKHINFKISFPEYATHKHYFLSSWNIHTAIISYIITHTTHRQLRNKKKQLCIILQMPTLLPPMELYHVWTLNTWFTPSIHMEIQKFCALLNLYDKCVLYKSVISWCFTVSLNFKKVQFSR